MTREDQRNLKEGPELLKMMLGAIHTCAKLIDEKPSKVAHAVGYFLEDYEDKGIDFVVERTHREKRKCHGNNEIK